MFAYDSFKIELGGSAEYHSVKYLPLTIDGVDEMECPLLEAVQRLATGTQFQTCALWKLIAFANANTSRNPHRGSRVCLLRWTEQQGDPSRRIRTDSLGLCSLTLVPAEHYNWTASIHIMPQTLNGGRSWLVLGLVRYRSF